MNKVILIMNAKTTDGRKSMFINVYIKHIIV